MMLLRYGLCGRSSHISCMQVRSAACIWLVSLVTFNSNCQALRQRLKDIQEAFGNLLGDSDELIQEMASRGVSAVYRLGSEADRKALLSALMGTLQGTAAHTRHSLLLRNSLIPFV